MVCYLLFVVFGFIAWPSVAVVSYLLFVIFGFIAWPSVAVVCYLFFDIQCYWFFLCGHLWLWFVICCLLFDVIGFIAWPSVAVGSCRLRPSAAKSGGKQFVTEAIARKYDTEIARKI